MMVISNEVKLEKKRIGIFALYCLLTVISGILSFIGFEPRYISDNLALLAAVIGGAIITYGSVKSLLEKDLTVDLLASIAIIVSIVVGQYLAAALVVVMLNGGEMAEEYAARRASQAIEKLIRSAPVKARVRRDGREVEIPVEEVRVGDSILVKPGEKIPLDGVVVKGNGLVNQASITGESMPIEKTFDREVYGNTLLEDGALEIRVTKEQKDTVFFRIVRLVEEGQANKAPVERVADKYARWFAPLIVVSALATQLITNDILATVAVLLVSCPCALTLATPIAVVVSMGNAAKNGILVRGGPSLEEIGKVDIVIVDKTGTLTKGSPAVVEVKALDGRSIEEIVELAAVAEKFSEHAIARAILEKAEDVGLNVEDPDDFEVLIGRGVVTKLGDKRIAVGNIRLLKEDNIVLEEPLKDYLTNQEANGRTSVFVTVDSELAGIISVADTLREDVASSINEMRRNGVKKVVMLTGDNRYIAEMISKQASIDETRAELLPEEKVEYIKSYQSQGHKVAMIGDGINDAPALTAADVGIAMGIAGTDVTIETAGIVLTTDDLSKVSKIIRLSRKTLNVIKQNVVFALAVNVLGILLSTQGVITPVAASIIHESSALIVVFNSLRLATENV
jgi:Cd2+/Zn2+-exporting ATPase